MSLTLLLIVANFPKAIQLASITQTSQKDCNRSPGKLERVLFFLVVWKQLYGSGEGLLQKMVPFSGDNVYADYVIALG